MDGHRLSRVDGYRQSRGRCDPKTGHDWLAHKVPVTSFDFDRNFRAVDLASYDAILRSQSTKWGKKINKTKMPRGYAVLHPRRHRLGLERGVNTLQQQHAEDMREGGETREMMEDVWPGEGQEFTNH